MNWNGGSLPRASKNAKASLSTVQKRHFAKARGKLRNGLPLSPGFDFSVFEGVKHEEKDSQKETRPLREIKPREETEPNRAESGANKHYQHHRSQETLSPTKSRHRYRNGSVSPLVEVEDFIEYRHQPKPRLPFAITSSPPPSSASTLRLGGSSIRRSCNAPPQVSVVTTLESKRLELLRKKDWVGLDSTKPVQMKFAETKDRDLIGKRRPLEERDNEGHNGRGSKRRKIAYGQGKLSTPFHISRGSASPDNISIRIGSSKARRRRITSRRSPLPSQDYNSVTSEEMLLAQEASETINGYQQTRGHAYSQILQSPLRAREQRAPGVTQNFSQPSAVPQTHFIPRSHLPSRENSAPRISPAFLLTSPVSQGRFAPQSISRLDEAQVAIPPSRGLASDPGDQSTIQVDRVSRLSRSNTLDDYPERRLIFDHLPQDAHEYQNGSEATPIKTPRPSSNASILVTTPFGTLGCAKHHDGRVGRGSTDLGLVLEGIDPNSWPSVIQPLLETVAENPAALNDDPKAVATESEMYLKRSEAQPVGHAVARQKLDSAGVEDEQQVGNDHVRESLEIVQESRQDEEKLWRDFVFGPDCGNEKGVVNVSRTAILPTKYGYDGSSMIAELDFREDSVPKSASLNTESSVVVDASQYPSAFYSTSVELESVLAQAPESPNKIQHATSDSSSDDPLAWTPRRFEIPKIIFKKPSKYLGGEEETPASICISSNFKESTLGRGRDSRPNELTGGKGKESNIALVLEDEIEDN